MCLVPETPFRFTLILVMREQTSFQQFSFVKSFNMVEGQVKRKGQKLATGYRHITFNWDPHHHAETRIKVIMLVLLQKRRKLKIEV